MFGMVGALNSGSVLSAPLFDSTAQPDTIASAQKAPNNVAVDEWYVYWTNHGVNGEAGQVMRANK